MAWSKNGEIEYVKGVYKKVKCMFLPEIMTEEFKIIENYDKTYITLSFENKGSLFSLVYGKSLVYNQDVFDLLSYCNKGKTERDYTNNEEELYVMVEKFLSIYRDGRI